MVSWPHFPLFCLFLIFIEFHIFLFSGKHILAKLEKYFLKNNTDLGPIGPPGSMWLDTEQATQQPLPILGNYLLLASWNGATLSLHSHKARETRKKNEAAKFPQGQTSEKMGGGS